MGSAAWFGLALLSGSKLVFTLAAFRHLANWWFLSSVEQLVTLPRRPISHANAFSSFSQPSHAKVVRRLAPQRRWFRQGHEECGYEECQDP